MISASFNEPIQTTVSLFAATLTCTTLTGYLFRTPSGEAGLSLAIEFGLTQIVNQPTRIHTNVQGLLTQTLLDVCLTDDTERIVFMTTCPPIGSSDHNVVVIRINTETPNLQPEYRRLVWHYNAADWNALRDSLSSLPWDKTFESSCVDTCWESFSKSLRAVMAKFIPHEIVNPKPVSYTHLTLPTILLV